MDPEHDRRSIGRSRPSEAVPAHPLAPGKRTLTEGLAVQRRQAGPAGDSARIQAAASRGTATPASELPYADQIQRAFGRHDITGIRAHVGPEAAASAHEMSARAYATGDHVVLGERADLHTVAHEAAHVVQQRGGVQLRGGVGEAGDVYERHADEVADRVVRQQSAEAVLDRHAPSAGARSPAPTTAGSSGQSVQRMGKDGEEEQEEEAEDSAEGASSSGDHDESGNVILPDGLELAQITSMIELRNCTYQIGSFFQTLGELEARIIERQQRFNDKNTQESLPGQANELTQLQSMHLGILEALQEKLNAAHKKSRSYRHRFELLNNLWKAAIAIVAAVIFACFLAVVVEETERGAEVFVYATAGGVFIAFVAATIASLPGIFAPTAARAEASKTLLDVSGQVEKRRDDLEEKYMAAWESRRKAIQDDNNPGRGTKLTDLRRTRFTVLDKKAGDIEVNEGGIDDVDASEPENANASEDESSSSTASSRGKGKAASEDESDTASDIEAGDNGAGVGLSNLKK